MSLPAHVERDVSSALEALGLGSRIVRATEVGGGCINHGTRVEAGAGQQVFLKWNTEAPAGMFAAEVDSLGALRSVAGVRAPEPLAHGAHWLLLEHVETGRERAGTSAALGGMLAALHAEGDGASFGWPATTGSDRYRRRTRLPPAGARSGVIGASRRSSRKPVAEAT